MEHTYMVLTLDATDQEEVDKLGEEGVLFVEKRFFHFDKKKAQALYKELKEKYSNVYLVKILNSSEHI